MSKKKSGLGIRMVDNYESITNYKLPKRTFTIIRLDGKSFSKFCKRFKKPFDDDFVRMMNETAKYVAENAQGCKIAFVQSDEITLILTDFDELTTKAWYDGRIQKICSISASLATSKFLQLLFDYEISKIDKVDLSIKDVRKLVMNQKLMEFDSRVYTVPPRDEVLNTVFWRQQDCTRNSVSMVAQSMYSHKELENKNNSQQQDLIHDKGQNWNDYPIGLKRGRVIVKRDGKWVIEEPPIFSQQWDFFTDIIPNYK
jgi:tRNA(His) 5'-end guanylyltransferase